MSEPYIVIDENRDINVPEELRGRIVQFDHNVETFTFQCPRYWDGRDLSTMKIFINYVIDPKKGTCSAYLAKELNVNEVDDNMTFDWVVTQDATTKEGELIIFVCAQLTDELGNLQHHWSSNFNKDFKLAKSYKCLQGIVDNYPNIIGQMLADIDKLKENGGSVTFTYNEATGDVTFGNETVIAAPEGIEAHTEVVSINGRGLQDAVARKKISELSDTINNMATSGMTTEQIDLLDAIGDYIPFKSEEGGAKWDELIASLRSGSSGGEEENPDSGETEVTLSSISATYTGGEVPTGTALSALTGITVTATYSDGTTKTVTGYTLSGEILEGENTVTVSYGGKTTSFTVTGIVESGGGDTTAELPTDGLVGYFDLRNATPEVDTQQGLTKFNANEGNGCLYTWSASTFAESNDYGTKLSRTLMYDANGGTTQTELGTSFSALLKGYNVQNGAFVLVDHTSLSNLNAFSSMPKYNNGSTQINVTKEEIGTKHDTGYIDVYFVVDGSIFKIYINGNLAKTYNGADYDGFVSWYSKISATLYGDNNYRTALVIYNKALSEVELTEARAYLQTLEVA